MTARLLAGWRWYEGKLKSNPYTANILSTMAIVTIGDVAAQNMELQQAEKTKLHHAANPTPAAPAEAILPSRPIAKYRSDQYEWRRTAIFTSFVLIGTPFWMHIYKLGDRLFQGNKSVRNAVKQGFFTWVVGMVLNPFFITYVSTASGVWIHGLLDPSAIQATVVERLQRNYLTQAGLALCFWGCNWPITFYYMPQHLRLFYVSWLQMVWNGVISYIQHRD